MTKCARVLAALIILAADSCLSPVRAQGWEAAVPILIAVGKQIAEANSPTVQKLRAIDSELGQINAKLDHLTELVVALPGVVTKAIQDHSVADTEAAIKNRFETASALINNYPPKEGPARIAFRGELLRLADETNSNVSYLLDAGPAVYPSASFGILLSTTMYKAIGQRAVMVDVVSREIGKFEYVTKADPNTSLVAERARIVKRIQDKVAAITALPRNGTTGCSVDSFPGRSPVTTYYQDRIEPAGVPLPPATFTWKDNGGVRVDPQSPFPGNFPAWLIGTEAWRGCDRQAHGFAAADAYNARLKDLRSTQDLLATYDKYLRDVDAVVLVMLNAAGLSQQQVDSAMKSPTAVAVIGRSSTRARQ